MSDIITLNESKSNILHDFYSNLYKSDGGANLYSKAKEVLEEEFEKHKDDFTN